jgi:predicted nucleotidyltransferase
MEYTKNKLPIKTHKFLNKLSNYLDTKLYFYGSVQRLDFFTNQSDIDILVDLDYTQRIGLGFIQMQYDLERLLSMKVDLVSSSSLSKHIKPIIDDEKKLIYAR